MPTHRANVSCGLRPEATPHLALHLGEGIDNVLLSLGILGDPEYPTNIWPRGARASLTDRLTKRLVDSY